jgi:hypothetical protein
VVAGFLEKGVTMYSKLWLKMYSKSTRLMPCSSSNILTQVLDTVCHYTDEKKIKNFSSFYEWSSCKVIYEEGLPNIWVNAQRFRQI